MARPGRGTIALSLLALLGVAVAATLWRGREIPGVGELPRRLENLGRVAVIGGDDLAGLAVEGTTFVRAAEVPGLEAALAPEATEGDADETGLSSVLAEAHVAALLVDGRAPPPASDATLLARLSRYESLELFSCAYLTPTAALYLPRSELVIGPPMDAAVAHVARAIVSGARPPRVHAFPEPLRRIRSVEVMVMLEEPGGRPRLWRSARGSSIARALLTASVVARQRWTEREAAMGDSIDEAISDLDVAVYLLDEDGTLGSRSAAFVDRVVSSEHGVAFDDHGTWRYLLPTATRERGEGSAVRAYRALFAESDMSAESLERDDIRPYRLLSRLLARSPAPRSTGALRPRILEGPDLFEDALAPGTGRF